MSIAILIFFLVLVMIDEDKRTTPSRDNEPLRYWGIR